MRAGSSCKRLVAAVLACGSIEITTAHAADATAATVIVHMTSARATTTGARVELRSVDSAPLSWSLEANDHDGLVIFRDIPAGDYRLTVKSPGFTDAVGEFRVEPAATHEIVAELIATATPKDRSSLHPITSEPVAYGARFDHEQISLLPTDRTLWSVLETTDASIIVDRIGNGGLWLGEPALLGAHGSSWTQTSIALGNVDVTDPGQGGIPLLRADPDAVQTVVVSSAALPAALEGPGPAITLVPRTIPSTWRGCAQVSFVPDELQSDNSLAGVASIARFDSSREGSVIAGGPLFRSRLGLFAAARVVASRRQERDDPTVWPTRVGSLFLHSAAGAGPHNRLEVVGTFDDTSYPYPGRARLRAQNVSEHDTFMNLQATWKQWTTGGTAWSVTAGYDRGSLTTDIDLSTSDPTSGGTVERLRDGPVPALFDSLPSTRQRWTADVGVQPVLNVLGPHHRLSAGVTFTRDLATAMTVPSPPAAETVDGIPARVWEYAFRGPETRWTSVTLAAHVADTLQLPEGVVVDGGLRVDAVRGAAHGANGRIAWLSLSPRITARWEPGPRKQFAVFGGYGRYPHRLPLDYFAFGDPAAQTGLVYRWRDENSDRLFQPGERGLLIAAVGPCCAGGVLNRIDPDLKRPYTDEFIVGVERRLAGGWSIRFAGLDRRESQLVQVINTGVGDGDYTLRLVPDAYEDFDSPRDDRPLPVYDRRADSFGRDRYLLTNPAGDTAHYQGVELTVERRLGRRWETLMGATAYRVEAMGINRGFRSSENDQGLIGELLEDPNALTYARGRGFFDRAYVVKWSGRYTAPKRFIVSAVARYQDGQPFARIVVIPDLNQGPEAISAYPRGGSRFAYTLTVDGRMDKTVSVGAVRLAGVLEVFNLLNTGNEVEEDVVTAPTFRRATAIQPPRAVRVGVRVEF